jgi:hypothetical protein
LSSLARSLSRCFESGIRIALSSEHRSSPQRPPVADRILDRTQAAIPKLRGHHVTLREEVASQALGDLVGIDLIVLFLAAAIARSISA